MEHDQEDATPSRGQNQLYVIPEEWDLARPPVAPMLDRLEADRSVVQLLILVNDEEAAVGIAEALLPALHDRGVRVLAATEPRRAARMLNVSPAQVIAVPPRILVALLRSSTVKLQDVRAVVLAWIDRLEAEDMTALEAVMSEVPKESARFVFAAEGTPVVEQIVERYARRARRMQSVTLEPRAPLSLSYVTVSPNGRASALRRLLDALDPATAFVLATSPRRVEEARTVLRSLGYHDDQTLVRAGDEADPDAELLLLYDLPASSEDLNRIIGVPARRRVVAFVLPRQLAGLRQLAGGTVSPLSLPEAAARARTREDRQRDELRAVLASGAPSRELLSLEPLLAEYDGVELAAAALRLLETERTTPGTASAQAPQMTRIFINTGTMDGVRPGDLVGAVTNEAGISREEVGKVDIRERHSLVEVATAVANVVVDKVTGATIRGRRVIARVDEDRDQRQRPRRDDVRLGSRDSRDQGGPSRDRGGRGGGRDRPRRDSR